ncbi:hypothetical protein ACHOLT_09445 [Desulfitobacterium sp. Sab5]|uniref:hypothetical protein n=1 Tax=Desulfitobacterium nosdiversum TaxID=3375356 RepID=UPI003CF96DB3
MKVIKSLLRILAITVIGLLSAIVLISPIKKDLWDVNSKLLTDKVLSVGQNIETVNLSDITPFEWDMVYSFQPYTPKDKIYNAIGYEWDEISETLNEGMNQIVFMNDGKVVCYVYGYPSDNGFYISFDSSDYKNGVVMFDAKDNLSFKVTKSKNILYLEQVKHMYIALQHA